MGLRSTSGQSTVEWVGIVLLVSTLMTGLVLAGSQVPALGLVHSISRQVLCAVSMSGFCDREGSLELAYGPDAAAVVRANAPDLYFGRDMIGMPVDYRTCRSPYCAETDGEGEITESLAGEQPTLFTRVVERDGSTYIQYWAYYPESASLRGVPVLEEEGYHRHDWESTQIRVDSDGNVSQRASSHQGHNHSRSAANWGSDMGWGFLSGAAEAVGLREPGGWGERTGELYVAGGSHAGNVADGRDAGNYPSWTPAERIQLVPLEEVRGDALSRAADFEPITPPWKKKLWRDPEETGTG